ncbi:phosphoribosylanthranilate isomerase [Youngiibacter fragilis]|uniref:N-(5'-phosphoribosyl)anthranilate isomerase n=1 Tax=Youngiibacter fragilis 232.1 TaxID=994573 RepID=V7I1X4_9CLOT|nr:phosphoribosylanthranilate isomerase [Youngiibacter fragilis]ETA79281.1 N-(5'-phosphoribosyl)anthranilate isomerase [Youngiibacter fragilis 232.1]
MTRLKICGLFREEDIGYANEVHPEYAGFVFAKSRRQVTRDKATELRKLLDPSILTVGVFVDEQIERILEILDDGTISIVQLHGNEDEEYIARLRERTSAQIIKAVRPDSREDVKRAESSMADYILFDSGAGTGKTFDWSLLEGFSREYFLAGGLNQGNMADAIELLDPFAVDLSSGVETEGFKDLEKMKEIRRMVRNG